MGLFKWFERLINERGSAAIMEKRLALKDDEIAVLQVKICELQASLDKQQIESDQVVLHKGIEFRRGIKTAGKWMGFCPKCHLPAEDAWVRYGKEKIVLCSARCGWQVFMKSNLQDLVGEIEV